jgi:hypothetical protein
MTYREAKRLKAKELLTFKEGGIKYKVFVTPENEDDLMEYLTDIRGFYSQLTDRVAKKYSKNGKFVLHELSYGDKRPHVLYKRLFGDLLFLLSI